MAGAKKSMETHARRRDGGLYLYCLSLKGAIPLSDKNGIDGKNPLFLLSYRSLRALVSHVSFEDYNEEALKGYMGDLNWLAPRVRRHQEIIAYAMDFQPVIPARFCTIYRGAERVRELMRTHYQNLLSFLNFIRDKEEWGVKVYAEESLLRKAVESSSQPLRALDEKISSALPGEGYFLKKKREEVVRQEIARLLDELSDEVYQEALSLSVEGKRNRLLSKEATGKEQEMLLNGAFLIKKKDAGPFKDKLNALMERHRDCGLILEVSGPWPPYNFCPQLEAAQ
mgnify:CR=1 FL=1